MLKAHVESSNIEQVGYKYGDLYLKFHSGKSYKYDKVPYAVFEGLTTAESAGNYFHRQVKGKFRYVPLENDPFRRSTDRH